MERPLFDLIKSLNRSEKRHFKLLANSTPNGKEKKYVQLFDLIDQQSHYQESTILFQLKGLGFSTDFLSASKSYLYKLVLKSLRDFHAKKTSKQRVLHALESIAILERKGLTPQALKLLRKTKKLAQEQELFSLLLELLYWERKLRAPLLSLTKIEEQAQELKTALAQLHSFTEYDFLYKKALIFRKKTAKSRSEEALYHFDELMRNPLLQDEKLATSFYAKLRYYQILAAYSYSKDNSKDEFICNQKTMHLIATNDYFTKEHPLEYIAIFSRYMVLSKKNTPQDYPKILAAFRDIPLTQNRASPKVAAMVFTLSNSTEFTRLIKEKDFTTALVQILPIQAGMKKYGKHIKKEFRMAMHYRFTYTYLATNKLGDALTEVNLLMEFPESTRPDLFRFARLLAIVIHFELGNYSLVTYLSQSFLLLLKKRNQLFGAETLFIQYMKKIIRLPLEKQQSVFIDFKVALSKILENPYEQKILAYFDLMDWVEGKVL